MPCVPTAIPERLGGTRLSCTLACLGRKSHHVTPAQLYNPHSDAATRLRPTGFIRTEPALGLHPTIGASADETLFVSLTKGGEDESDRPHLQSRGRSCS